MSLSSSFSAAFLAVSGPRASQGRTSGTNMRRGQSHMLVWSSRRWVLDASNMFSGLVLITGQDEDGV